MDCFLERPLIVENSVVISVDEYRHLMECQTALLEAKNEALQQRLDKAESPDRSQDFFHFYAKVTKSFAVRSCMGANLLPADFLIIEELCLYMSVADIAELIEYPESDIEALLTLAEEFK